MKLLKINFYIITVSIVMFLVISCGNMGGNNQTISSISKKHTKIEGDIPVQSSRKKAISQYRKLLNENSEEITPEVKRRLGDLRMEENEDHLADTVTVADEYTFAETISLYEDILENDVTYKNSDRVLYQLSRAYELSSQYEKALQALDQLVYKYPNSDYFVEAQFRRGEILFVEKKYPLAEDAYASVISHGPDTEFYMHSLYKHGWTHFKQVDYDLGLPSFNGVLEVLLTTGVEENDISKLSEPDQELLDDTLRATGLSFGYLGGAKEVSGYFVKAGRKPYEVLVYERLGKQYLDKKRWSDAANTYREYVETHKFDARAPHFQIKSIEAYKKGGFPTEVLRAKKQFVVEYNINSEYWVYNDIEESSDIVILLKTTITDLAKHYHSIAQNEKKKPNKFYNEAATWYRAYLESFPDDDKSPEMNFYLAEIYYETKRYNQAVVEYENTAYEYTKHQKSAESGYAAIISYNEWIKIDKNTTNQIQIKSKLIDSSFKFAENFPKHPEVPKVMTVAAEELYSRKNYERAIVASNIVIDKYPNADKKLLLSSWTVSAHSSFDTGQYAESEKAYMQALQRVNANKELSDPLKKRLAASIYKQGEMSKKEGNLDQAVQHYLRVGAIVPDAEIRATAQYDAAAALLELEDWDRASSTLEDFRVRYPKHKLQADVTKKLAVSYEKGEEHIKAAKQYEVIAQSTKEISAQRNAQLQAAELYTKGGDYISAEKSLKIYIEKHPKPIEPAMEAMQKLVVMYAQRNRVDEKYKWQDKIIEADAKAGEERSARTKYLAANATLELAHPEYVAFSRIRLGHPLKKNLKSKKRQMQIALDAYETASKYKVEQVTTAATFWTARIYYDLSVALMESDRPPKLSEEELAQYDILLEEQAYPFEEKAIEIHELNVSRLYEGIYDEWVKKSLSDLATLAPAQYVKAERSEDHVQIIY